MESAWCQCRVVEFQALGLSHSHRATIFRVWGLGCSQSLKLKQSPHAVAPPPGKAPASTGETLPTKCLCQGSSQGELPVSGEGAPGISLMGPVWKYLWIVAYIIGDYYRVL